jgi:hypothetical protein
MTNQAAVARLLARAGFADSFELVALTGGRNNRVWRVESDRRVLLLKEYFRHPGDQRDRLGTEFAFARFAWEQGLFCVPEPLAADAAGGLALYEFVEGRIIEPGELAAAQVQQAADFFARLNKSRTIAAAQQLPEASEACFSLAEHIACLRRRIERLSGMAVSSETDEQAQALARSLAWQAEPMLADLWRRGGADDQPLSAQQRCLSPSDFGFHNALVRGDGRLAFFDFEYAGWDDPARSIVDFFCQVAVPVPLMHLATFASTALAPFERDCEDLLRRIGLLFPLYRLKWCCIVLNEFLPESSERRRFSLVGNYPDDRKLAQLKKAQRLMEQLAQPCAA